MKKGFLVAVYVILGAVIIGLGAWYVNTNINPAPADNTNNNSGSTSTMDGLQIVDTTVGTGTVAENGDVVAVDYVGKLDDGTTFDSSASHGQPISFTLGAGRVIPGWDMGILGMKVGGTRELTIPASLGYGAQGYPPVIPPNATLHFTVTLRSVTKPTSTQQ